MANSNTLTKFYTGTTNSLALDDLMNNPVKIALLSSSYTPSMSHTVYTDLTNELATANGYTSGGLTLTGKTITGGVFKATNPAWTATGTLVAFYWVLYIDAGTKPLVAYGELNNNAGSPVAVTTLTGDNLTLFVASTGFLSLTVTNGSL